MVHDSRSRRREATRDELLDAALALVAEGGLDALTVGRLADRMGWTKGAMYRYFPGMGPLIAALNARVLEAWSAEADRALASCSAPPGDALGRLRVLMGAWIGLALDRPDQFGLVAVTLADPRVLVERVEHAVHVPALVGVVLRVAGLLQAAASTGQLAPGDANARALRLLFGVQGVLQLRKLLVRGDASGRGLAELRKLAAATVDDLLIAWAPRSQDAR